MSSAAAVEALEAIVDAVQTPPDSDPGMVRVRGGPAAAGYFACIAGEHYTTRSPDGSKSAVGRSRLSLRFYNREDDNTDTAGTSLWLIGNAALMWTPDEPGGGVSLDFLRRTDALADRDTIQTPMLAAAAPLGAWVVGMLADGCRFAAARDEAIQQSESAADSLRRLLTPDRVRPRSPVDIPATQEEFVRLGDTFYAALGEWFAAEENMSHIVTHPSTTDVADLASFATGPTSLGFDLRLADNHLIPVRAA